MEKKSLESESFRIKCDFCRLDRVKKNSERLKRYGEKIEQRRKLRLRESLSVGEEVLVLAGRLKKKDSPGKFLKVLLKANLTLTRTKNRWNKFFLAKKY